jgi:hypothetical protein
MSSRVTCDRCGFIDVSGVASVAVRLVPSQGVLADLCTVCWGELTGVIRAWVATSRNENKTVG